MEDGSCALNLEHPTVNPPLEVIKRTGNRFTKENAREMALRGRVKARENRLKRLQERLAPDAPTARNGGYVAERIVCVRSQIEALDRRLSKARTAKDIKFLADSIAKLCEVERVLSGRPLPGQLRPKNGQRASNMDTKTRVEPVDEVPSDTPVS